MLRSNASSLLMLVARRGLASKATPLAAAMASGKVSRSLDCIVVGAGHNGLVAAAYLAEAGLRVCVLESRRIIGGAAVTEEIVPGFRFSRCSYVLSLLRPKVVADLQLERHGLKVYDHHPTSYVPLLEPTATGARSLLLGKDEAKSRQAIAAFSQSDAEQYFRFSDYISGLAGSLQPLLDNPPFNLHRLMSAGGAGEKLRELKRVEPLIRVCRDLGPRITQLYELLSVPASRILDRWLENGLLKANISFDSIIGAMVSPTSPGSGYVLLHHVMGEFNGTKGAWGFVRGGMGAVSGAIAFSAVERGVTIYTEAAVSQIKVSQTGVEGVVLADGSELDAPLVLSNATPKVTFEDLVPREALPDDFRAAIQRIDYSSPVTKINVAVSRLPNFLADPNPAGQPGAVAPEHFKCPIQLNAESYESIDDAFHACQRGFYSNRPIIEMSVPSAVDDSLAPKGAHVVQLFTQYTPRLLHGKPWTEADKEAYKKVVFDSVDRYAPGFSQSVLGYDILTPQDLERIFGLTGGNIFHGGISLDQLYFMRPTPEFCDYRSPISGLYLCGSGAHPGGGVMGAPGRLCALEVIGDVKRRGGLRK